MNWGELWKLSGIVIVVVGLALRLRTTLVVVTAALVTGLIAGLPLFTNAGVLAGVPLLTRPVAEGSSAPEGIINMLGRAFTDFRYVTLFIITLPAIGLAERFGLQEQAAAFIRRIRAATVGRLQIVYQLFRVLVGILGIRVNGHPVFVRPLIFPMSVGALEATSHADSADELPPAVVEEVKAANSAGENYGNFYGQNLNIVQAGILLVEGTLRGQGYAVSTLRLVLFAIPIATLTVLLGALQFLWLDRWIARQTAKSKEAKI
ncbi:MAG TPA: DUF969 family protein [Blastocatellia bacterium]|nr:DUF969 family protein [Blastocatellia bacterium]